jgi:hypothetical protein
MAMEKRIMTKYNVRCIVVVVEGREKKEKRESFQDRLLYSSGMTFCFE